MSNTSTGIVTNTRDFGTAASNVVVNTRNLSGSAALITVEIFASVDSETFYTAYLSSYTVAANGFDVRTFFIGGNVAYEVQISNPSTQLMSVYGIDEFGNLVIDQQFEPSALSSIPVISSPM